MGQEVVTALAVGPRMEEHWNAGNASPMASAWTADQRNETLGQDLTRDEETTHGALVRAASHRELGDWQKSQVFEPAGKGEPSRAISGTRWVLRWQMVDGRRDVEAGFAAKGYQNPDLGTGLVETSGCVGIWPPHLRAIPLRALKKWQLSSLDIKNAFFQANGPDGAVYLRAPSEWDP